MIRAVLIVSAFSLAACDVGEVDIGGGAVDAPIGNSAKSMMFDSTIKPMVMALGCMDVGCHSGVQNPVMNTYASIEARYKTGPGGATNILVIKGGATPPGDHNGPYFDATQRATVAAWIDMAP